MTIMFHKMVNGVKILLTQDEVSVRQQEITDWVAAQIDYTPPMDPIVALTALLVSKGVIEQSDAIDAMQGTMLSDAVSSEINKSKIGV